MPTLHSQDIEAGKALLWPPATRVLRVATWGEEGEYHYPIEGDELWVGSDDCNDYGRASTPEVQRRMIAAWNSYLGVSTEVLERLAKWVVASGVMEGVADAWQSGGYSAGSGSGDIAPTPALPADTP